MASFRVHRDPGISVDLLLLVQKVDQLGVVLHRLLQIVLRWGLGKQDFGISRVRNQVLRRALSRISLRMVWVSELCDIGLRPSVVVNVRQIEVFRSIL